MVEYKTYTAEKTKCANVWVSNTQYVVLNIDRFNKYTFVWNYPTKVHLPSYIPMCMKWTLIKNTYPSYQLSVIH